jgi:sugar transferase (PEP-CTERM/EpsH1 system associated)
MKILIIDEEFPYPLDTGKRIRSFNLARALSCNHEISYLAYGQVGSAGYEQLGGQNLRPIAVDPPDRRQSGLKFYFRLLLNLLSPYPYIVSSHYTDRFAAQLQEIVETGQIDCILCEWSPYAIFLRDLKGPKRIIVAHNVESAIWRGYEAKENNPFRRLYIAIQSRKVAAFESECFGWAEGATAVSEADADLLRRYAPGYDIEVVENGVDIDYFRPQIRGVNEDMLVFTGSMDWRPNQDAAIFFAHEIFPILRQRRPSLNIFFVGRRPGRKIRELARIPGFYVTGTVDDVRPYIAEAAVYVVPLRIGGGSRLKILEAMSMKKAVVSTAVGAEGLRVCDGENIIIRDDPQGFADAILACIDDKALAARIGESGMETVHRYYRWDELGKKLSDYICKVARAN